MNRRRLSVAARHLGGLSVLHARGNRTRIQYVPLNQRNVEYTVELSMGVRAYYVAGFMLEWLSDLAWVEHEARNEVPEFTEASMVAWQMPTQSVELDKCTLVQLHGRCASTQSVCVNNGPPGLVFSRRSFLPPRHMGVKRPRRAVM